jgi:hypothetical protein
MKWTHMTRRGRPEALNAASLNVAELAAINRQQAPGSCGDLPWREVA